MKQNPTPARELIRLDADMYAQLCRDLQAIPYVNHQTTELQAGYQLGIQAVLIRLREGFVVQR